MRANTAKKLSQKIKDKISEAGISVHALEKKAGLKQSAVQNILYGKSKKPSLHIMQSIAQALNCTVLELMEEESEVSLSEGSTRGKTPYSDSTIPWNANLFIEALNTVHMLSKKKHIFLSKEKMLDCGEEIYEYSAKNKKNKPDKHFAEWLIEKSSKT